MAGELRYATIALHLMLESLLELHQLGDVMGNREQPPGSVPIDELSRRQVQPHDPTIERMDAECHAFEVRVISNRPHFPGQLRPVFWMDQRQRRNPDELCWGDPEQLPVIIVRPDDPAAGVLDRHELRARLIERTKACFLLAHLLNGTLAIRHIDGEGTHADDGSAVVAIGEIARLDDGVWEAHEAGGVLASERAADCIDRIGLIGADLPEIRPLQSASEFRGLR